MMGRYQLETIQRDWLETVDPCLFSEQLSYMAKPIDTLEDEEWVQDSNTNNRDNAHGSQAQSIKMPINRWITTTRL
jgi:hypothetical protein